MSETAISRQPRVLPDGIGVYRYESIDMAAKFRFAHLEQW
jgi:hypothetical protein